MEENTAVALSTNIKPEDCIIKENLEEKVDDYSLIDNTLGKYFILGQMIISGYYKVD